MPDYQELRHQPRSLPIELFHIVQYRFEFDDIMVVLRFAVLRDPYKLPLRIADHVIVLRGFFYDDCFSIF